MSNGRRLALRVDQLSKRYVLGERARYHALRDTLAEVGRLPGRILRQALRQNSRSADREFWALRDVGFEVANGEVVGVIGRNGAGKSTLLKILSRITAPTEGYAELHGRVASLLEVGTGFHPELTGRENVFLNGAILGMKRAEINRKFDEIVAFAEIERFLDTPVKHYSSGMQMRLAFAVAAHLEPEILLIDEVLAVGDASFQKKCLGKMEDIRRTGRTLLFVSHNMQAVTRLCPRTILLSDGHVIADGPSHQVVTDYLKSGTGTIGFREWTDLTHAPGNSIVRLCSVRIRSQEGETLDAVDITRPFGIEMRFAILDPDHVLSPNFHIFNEDGICVFAMNDTDPDWRRRPRPSGDFVSTMWIPGNFLAEGTFTVWAAISRLDPVEIHCSVQDAVAFQVIDNLEANTARGDYVGHMPGVVRPCFPWTTETDVSSAALRLPTRIEHP